MTQRLVLVGGGHAHVQILRRWMMQRVEGVHLTVVLDRPVAVYSGMVPAFVAGEIDAHELEIDVVPLARRAGAAVVLSAATRIDADGRRIECEGRAPIPYDVASLDVGSTVRGLDGTPGAREFALSTRPIGRFTAEIDARLAALPAGGPPRVAIVGGGAAGVELAMTLGARLRSSGREPQISVVSAQPLLAGASPALVRRTRRELEERGVEIAEGSRVVAVKANSIATREGAEEREQPTDLVVWATGGAPLPLLPASPLPLDERGFVRVDEALRVEGRSDLFAVGDCASLSHAPWVPKAGVYAVRQGPVLDRNLRRTLEVLKAREGASSARLQPYRPQRDFLALLNCGGGRAIGGKWGRAFAGRSVHRLKDWIDRRFMQRFQVLAPDGEALPTFAAPMREGDAEMECGGCAAKLDATSLGRALAALPVARADADVVLGLEGQDDAAAVRFPSADRNADEASRGTLVLSVDGFRSFTDDPFEVGRIATQNALGDLAAKGARARHALAMVTVDGDPVQLEQALAGIRSALDEARVTLLGGHTMTGDFAVGLAVVGELGAGEEPLPLGGARPGDALLLTHPLGTGVLFAADMRGLARGPWIQEALRSMASDKARAATIAREFGATACTDVSGFGLGGHLTEMCRASGVSAYLDAGTLPALPGALECLGRGLRSTGHANNAGFRSELDPGSADPARAELLFDPQTSGGLLMSVPEDRAKAALRALIDAGATSAARIGQVEAARDGAPRIQLIPGRPS